jgi:hypothetical protein
MYPARCSRCGKEAPLDFDDLNEFARRTRAAQGIVDEPPDDYEQQLRDAGWGPNPNNTATLDDLLCPDCLKRELE